MKIFEFFLKTPYFGTDEKMGFWEETIFKHFWNDDLGMFERNGFNTEVIWLIILTIAVVILWLSVTTLPFFG